MSTYTVEVCTVDEVRHHPDADRLDIVKIKGWECITGRDDHILGDTVIFVPPDSLVTDSFVNEFNITYLKGKGKNRIGAVKLRGEWSEGLVVPNKEGFKVGEDVAGFYEIVKYEPIQPPTPGSDRKYRRGDKHIRAKHRLYGGLFPKYTHIENVKNFQSILERDELVVITEKVHGTNFRAGSVPLQGGKPYKLLMKIFGRSHQFLVGSRNVILDYDTKRTTFYGDNVYAKAAKMWTLEMLPEDYIVYGEVYGVNTNGKAIQKSYTYDMAHLGVKFFDVSYKREYLSPYEAINFLEAQSLPTVPLLYVGPWDLKLITKYTNRMSRLDPYTLQEGFVVRPVTPRHHKRVGRVIFKAVSPAYLAQKDRTEGH